ncbi:radical SAM enzyme, Cfr family domain-containing protein [Theileria equi strain WA]|uniref:Radical SAM enzyme, Cfr family domain-containing protein n=1 Tax=Theileria equi strain WA TaxID=1537102 RepID=L0B2C2_THEEQ|nr:radical SAM enzyme, Cfr family domain-containing protein [Theileria equi strain WA]AFZ81643.1 radical SAM enzyme, Cfr family domain-containing protein [Theileria equi strain WA]|eukprot:XP_004831309.1 radical SAM enzyme, Cfr family domain-containing protein [Theileria equi strain WA]
MDRSARFGMIHRYAKENALPSYRVTQVFQSIYKNKTPDFLSMYHIPKVVRHGLNECFEGSLLSITPITESKAESAHKVLFKNRDNTRIESVLLYFKSHKSLCISSQVGCAHACSFCATGKIGLKRNLTVDEITDQILYFQQRGHKIDSISFMGMGEPLSNPNVFRSIKVLTDRNYFAISPRRINISTVGILPGIKKLNKEQPFVNFAYSLHSPYTHERNEMVPANRIYPFQEAYELMDERIRQTGKRIWISYVLMKDKNDSKDHAKELVSIIKNRPEDSRYLYHVNLIPYNSARAVEGIEKLDDDRSLIFQKILEKNKVSCSYRNYYGRSIDAACGQLYADYEVKDKL